MTLGALASYVGLGILSDLLITFYYICVARGRAWPAALTSLPIALLNFWVFDRVLIVDKAWWGAVAYAVGNAVGCLVIMSLAKGKHHASADTV